MVTRRETGRSATEVTAVAEVAVAKAAAVPETTRSEIMGSRGDSDSGGCEELKMRSCEPLSLEEFQETAKS
jgi:hypothetical protein